VFLVSSAGSTIATETEGKNIKEGENIKKILL
jgi:hypothetical protein